MSRRRRQPEPLPDAPDDWAELHWHRDPSPSAHRYRSFATAQRACSWLNANEHTGDRYLYRPGGGDQYGVWLERRWVGTGAVGLIDLDL